jgi:hypothetical protein
MSPHIFISYKTEEVEYADQLRSVLERIGYNVWWDQEIQTGHAWHEAIDRQLKTAACVIVLWSRRAINSKWIALEAAHALARDVYVPVRIELADVPAPYNHIQAATLAGWDGRLNTSEFPQLRARIAELIGEKVNNELALEGFTPWPNTVPQPRMLRFWSWLLANSLGVLAILAATITIIAVSISLNRQIGKLDKATKDIDDRVAAANKNLEEAQRAIARTLYPITSMKVSYFLTPDWNQTRLKDCFEQAQQKHNEGWKGGEGLAEYGFITCSDKDRVLRDTLFGVDVNLFFFKNRIDPTTFGEKGLRSQFNQDLFIEVDNPHRSLNGVVRLNYEIANREVKRLELKAGDQTFDSTSYGWHSNTVISSVSDLLGSQLIIQMEDIAYLLPGSLLHSEEAAALRRTVKLNDLVVKVSSGITMAFDAKNLKEYVGRSGYRYYVFDFPTSMEELSSATRYDRFKRLEETLDK